MEKQYTERHTYEKATIGAHKKTDVLTHHRSSQGWYQLMIIEATSTHFTLQAVPTFNDQGCQTLTLTQQGVQGIASSPFGTPTQTSLVCWSS